MKPERRCPKCNNPVPLLATECLFCNQKLGAKAPSGAPSEAPRFQVIRSGQGRTDDVPEDVRKLGEQSRVYYCKLGGQTVGPVTAADIREAFAKGQINGQASVGIQGRKEWYPIRALPQFSLLITGMRPVPPTRPPLPQGDGMMPPPPGAGPVQGSPPPPLHADQLRLPLARPTPPPLVPTAQGDDPARRAAPGPLGLVPSDSSRNDGTLLVAPLPHPDLLKIGSNTGQVVDPQLASWQREVRSWRRLAFFFGVVASALLLLSAALVGILISR